jgi:EAL domain-containing protein (putative c-di-GMP-specific phosphodiesterase class I)
MWAFRALTGVVNTERLAEDLDIAVRRREIFVVYQPQISLATGSTVAVEALCRWTHPEFGSIGPELFIPIAERAGIIGALGSFVLEESLTAGDEWRRTGREVEIAVNVSPLQLADDLFSVQLAGEVRRRSLSPGSLTIEITESLPLVDRPAVATRLQELHAIGVGVSLDDFGTGHASRENLETLPLTEVKLDGSLIRDVERHPDAELHDVVRLAHERALRVVAEGVETLSDLDRAVSLGCDRVQGFLIGQPLPRGEIEPILGL